MRKKNKKRGRKPAFQESVEIPECWQRAVNKVVRYYSDGWYAGYLINFTKKGEAVIQPIGALNGKIPHTQTFPLNDLKLVA